MRQEFVMKLFEEILNESSVQRSCLLWYTFCCTQVIR